MSAPGGSGIHLMMATHAPPLPSSWSLSPSGAPPVPVVFSWAEVFNTAAAAAAENSRSGRVRKEAPSGRCWQ